jgi:PAS domain-containing protein
MIDRNELGALFDGLRAVLTVADEDGIIIFMNDLAIEHYGDRGGESLIGTSLHDCHNPTSQDKIRQLYARYRAGDLTPTRYHEEKGDSLAESIVLIPLIVAGQFRGVAELMWTERPELVFEF